MLTVLQSINLSTEFLKNKGIESPRQNAELLLAKILKCKKLDLYLSFDKPLKDEEVDSYREFIRRRSQFEPLQYIVGSVEFYGLELKVNPSVLIPRPETEILVETIIENHKDKENLKILDIGTGSGNISIALAKHLNNCEITAIDINEDAIKTAGANASFNKVEGQIHFIKKDILNGNKISDEKFDIIVSNPPYIALNEFPSLQPELKEFEPKSALTDFSDGLKFYEKIVKDARNILLKPNGHLYFELGKDQHSKVEEFFKQNKFSCVKQVNDYQNIERVIYGELEPVINSSLEEN
jgi:release factor glutamine methyltransferase